MTIASETQESGSAANTAKGFSLPALLNWRAAFLIVPRERCHYAVFDIGQIPRRYVMSSLRLQIMQTTGIKSPGFACRPKTGKACVWFWEEIDGFPAQQPGTEMNAGVECQPWPEPLMRGPLVDGLHLISCGRGYEAVAVEKGEIRRTRWFRSKPTDDAWVAFVRDSGRDPVAHITPDIKHPTTLSRPPKGWRLSSSFVPPKPWFAFGMAATLAIAGSLVIVASIYNYKLNSLIEVEEADLVSLRRDNAAEILLQQEAARQREYLAALEKSKPALTQLELLGEFAGTELLGAPGGISIWEWEYRSGRLSAYFSVPDTEFSLGDFLQRIEAIPILEDIRLVSDSPRGTVGIQANLVRRRTTGATSSDMDTRL